MTKCKRCGREFLPQVRGQQFCYESCVPTRRAAVSLGMTDESRWKRDCIMFREDGINGPSCSGLVALYCGLEECKFYKPKKGDR